MAVARTKATIGGATGGCAYEVNIPQRDKVSAELVELRFALLRRVQIIRAGITPR